MQNAVRFLGKPEGKNLEANFGGESDSTKQHGKARNDIVRRLAIEALNARIAEKKVGGGGRSRTYDAADMSRVL